MRSCVWVCVCVCVHVCTCALDDIHMREKLSLLFWQLHMLCGGSSGEVLVSKTVNKIFEF